MQWQASEVLHTLMRHQQQLLKLPQALPGHASSEAAQGSDRGEASELLKNDGCSDSNRLSSSSSSSGSNREGDSKVSCKLEFGAVPAGMEVRQTFYVSNSGEGLLVPWQGRQLPYGIAGLQLHVCVSCSSTHA
jgi:hypothetical protein